MADDDLTGNERGLDADGCILREGSLEKVAPPYRPAVDDLRRRMVEAFHDEVDGLYLYGSVPRGAAVLGQSDLDAMLVTDRMPTDEDARRLREVERWVDESYSAVDGVEVLHVPRAALLAEEERYDGGFFVACLCTPLYGRDLAGELPRYRPDDELARETNGNLGERLPVLREQLRSATGATARRHVCRRIARKVLRTAFALVMPRWRGWTSDLTRSARIVSGYYPAWSAPLHRAAVLARVPSRDVAAGLELLDLGDKVWAEFAERIGPKRHRWTPPG